MNAHCPSADIRKRDTSAVRATWLLLCIILVGFLTRLYHIQYQSAWVDEYFNLVYHNAPSLGAFLDFVRLFGLDITPLGFALLYLWGQVVGNESLVLLRLGTVAAGVACVPLAFWLGHRIRGRNAGLVAALLVAISPTHIWTSQSLRPNVFIELAALVSLCGLVAACGGRERLGWFINGTANLALMWIHPFSAFLIGAEGLFLSWRFWNSFRRLFFWGLVHFVIVLSPLLWMKTTLSYVASAEDDFIMQPPPIGEIIADWLGDDAVQMSDPFAFQGDTWPFLHGSLRDRFVSSHVYWDRGLMAFYGLIICFLLWRLVRRETPPKERENAALLLAISTLPLALTVAATHLWRPIILPRYTSYTSFALYLAAGWVLSGLKPKGLRGAALAGVAVLYAYQLSFQLPASTRTNWLAAGRAIQAQASPSDLVLVRGTHWGCQNFRLNMQWQDLARTEPAYSLQSLCMRSSAFFAEAGNAGLCVWAMVEPFVYTLPPLAGFEECLHDRGLCFEVTYFPGMNGLHLYRIRRDPAQTPMPDPKPVPTDVDYAGLARELGLDPSDPAVDDALRQALDSQWPPTRFYFSLLAFQLMDGGHADLAAASARRAIQEDPTYLLGPFALALALYEAGDIAGARHAYAMALEVDRIGYFEHYRPLLVELYEKGNPDAARVEFERLDRWGLHMPFAIRRRFLPRANVEVEVTSK